MSSGRAPSGQALVNSKPAAFRPPGFDPSRSVEGEVISPRSTDDEASAILDELNRLQTWCVMNAHIHGAMAAGDLVQRTRILIIERCKRHG